MDKAAFVEDRFERKLAEREEWARQFRAALKREDERKLQLYLDKLAEERYEDGS